MTFNPIHLSPDEITRRINKRACLRCGISPLELDEHTGFPKHFCFTCQEILNKAPGPKAGAAKARKQHKLEGLDNLDRLTK